MKKIIWCFLVTFWFAISVTPSYAYKSYGAGAQSCGKWVEARKNGDYFAMGNWMLGYITSYGYYGKDRLKEVDYQAFVTWMDSYCQKSPLDDFETGIQQLIETLKVIK